MSHPLFHAKSVTQFGRLEYRDRIQRKAWCMGPYCIPCWHNLTLGRLQSRLQHIYHGQSYARVDLKHMTLNICQSRTYHPVRNLGFDFQRIWLPKDLTSGLLRRCWGWGRGVGYKTFFFPRKIGLDQEETNCLFFWFLGGRFTHSLYIRVLIYRN